MSSSLLQLVRINVGQVGVQPGTLKMLSTANLTTITTAGYLNNIGGTLTPIDIAPSDIIECLYSYNTLTQTGTYVQLEVSITNGVITLSASSGSEALPSGYIFVGNASNVAVGVPMTGDITITNAGVTAIGAGVIVNADINAAAAIAFSKFASLATGHILAGNAGVVTDVTLSGDATIGATGVLTIANSAITNAKVSATAAIDFSKLAALTSGNILVGSAGNVPTSVAMSGDATIVASGALTIASNAITTAKILNANVTLAKLATGITPAYVSKFGGQQANGGGSATITITVTGLTTSHICLANVQASTNAVSVQKVTPTADTLTVLLSGDPGANTIIAYQAFLAAS